MLDRFQGLPVHPLIVHATVVILPTAAILVGLAAVYPRFRNWAGPVPMIAAIVGAILVPLSTMSGDKFYDRFKKLAGGDVPLIEDHEHLANLLIFFAVPLAVIAIIGYLLHRRGSVPAASGIAVAVLSVALAGAVLVDVALIGHAGAKAVYTGSP